MSLNKAAPAQDYIPFTEEMKREYTILVPMMLPMHFELIINVFRNFGYKMELLRNTGSHIADTGLHAVHNDTCYPAILVIGQFLDALRSGNYDPHKTALMLFQTGGGCRASNYISLLRKALKKEGYGYIPVISFSFANIEKHPGFKITLPIFHKLLYALLYGDLLMTLYNQCRPYEDEKGAALRLAEQWTTRLADELAKGGFVSYRQVKENYKKILAAFSALPRTKRDAVRVGIVGEIFVKYSPLGNNDLEQFLVSEGAEPVVPGLLDFMLYCFYDNMMDYRLYGISKRLYPVWRTVYGVCCRKKHDLIDVIRAHGAFTAPTPFEDVTALTKNYIGNGAKMGEGWLLTAEMLELSRAGVGNIVCAQPFGCLPNHICGKGMMRPVKEHNPDVNIVAIDYDAGATRVNQENRLKLMLANAKLKKQN